LTPSVRLVVRVAPRASRTAVRVDEAGQVKVSVTDAPVDGQANQAVIEVLAKALRLPRRTLTVVSGHTAKTKTILIEGLDEAALAARLADLNA